MAAQKLPRVLSFRKATNPRNGIEYYGNVQSRSRGTRIIHTVTIATRKERKLFRCSCEAASFKPRIACIHVEAVVPTMRQREEGRWWEPGNFHLTKLHLSHRGLTMGASAFWPGFFVQTLIVFAYRL